jgi:hypothetical protein
MQQATIKSVNHTCNCLDGCHGKPEQVTAETIISKLTTLINSITRKTHDGRREAYCAGNCNMICDLHDVGDFSALDQAEAYMTMAHIKQAASNRDQLRDRIADICCGACGRFVGDEDETLAIEELSRVIPAMQATWPNLPDWVWFPHNLDKFVTVDSITEFIFGALQG